MKSLNASEIAALRQRLARARRGTPGAIWQRARQLLRKAAVQLSLTDAEWEELCRLLPIEQSALTQRARDLSEPQGKEPERPGESVDEASARAMALQHLSRENERPGRLQQFRQALERLSRR